ncbi:MAG: Cof-type HAD-IIB family hydrolase [Patescibacteria group bacterium]
MPIKLLLVDLDDTLLGGDQTISPANREALLLAAGRGVMVALATGRMYQSARPYAEELALTLPVIAYNGALARPLSGPPLWHQPLANGVARALLARLARYDVTVNLYLEDELYVARLDERAAAYAANTRVRAIPVGDLGAFLGRRRPTKLLAIGRPETVTALRLRLGEEFRGRAEIVPSKPAYLEIMAPGVTKGAALARLASGLGIARDETMAVGDGPNDLGMLAWAGIGVAVGNAAPEVLAAAARVVAPSGRDGVAEAVRRFILEDRG